MEQTVRLEPLDKKDFKIYTSRHHTFGTDAVLLSNFANAKTNDVMCDLGTGCGIIPFLMLRDKKLKSAVGVDISGEAITLAEKTKQRLKLTNFTPVLSDLNDLKGKVNFGCHTLVTCNPPYKAAGAGIKNPDSIDSAARHEIYCTLDDILRVSAKLLQTGGRLCMCHRPERLAELMHKMRENKLEPKRMRLVAQRKDSAPWLVLVEARRGGNTGLSILPTLIVEDENGNFSSEMLDIYGVYKGENG